MDRFSKRILIVLTSVVVLMAIILTIDIFLSHSNFVATSEWNVFESIIDVIALIATIWIGAVANSLSCQMNKRDLENKDRTTSSVVSLSKVNTSPVIPLSPETSNCKGENILCFSVENSGEAMLQKIKLSSDCYNEFEFVSHLSVPKGSSKSVRLTLPDYFRNENKIRITFISCYGKETYGTFVLKEIENKSNCSYYKKCKKRGECKFSIKYYHYNAFDAKGQ